MTDHLKTNLFTSESVSEGHPDKLCDQISDAVLDALLAEDPNSRVACETLAKNNTVVLAGEVTTNAKVHYRDIVRQTIKEIGYTEPEIGFDDKNCNILQLISEQSPDISQGVSEGEGLHNDQGAGDQGLMFGFACNETPDLMPLPIALSHRLLKILSDKRRAGDVDFLRPDSKSQVTVLYENGQPKEVDAVVVSTQHNENASLDTIKEYIIEEVVKQGIPDNFLTDRTRYYINPTGKFIIGGPVGDCGLTGRKIIVDTYGGYGRHGGGAFSGKDPSKVDRSATYMARYVAKNIVAAGLADKCEVQLAYAIGVAEPVGLYVSTFGTGKVPDESLPAAIDKVFDLTPKGIIKSLDLLRPIYQATASYGHFGREPEEGGFFSWEKTDKAEELKNAAG